VEKSRKLGLRKDNKKNHSNYNYHLHSRSSFKIKKGTLEPSKNIYETCKTLQWFWPIFIRIVWI